MKILLLTVFLSLTICKLSAQQGVLDSSFGTDGKVITNIDLEAGANAVAIQSDGKIVAAGWTKYSGGLFSYDFTIAQYNPDGSLDNSFGSQGVSIPNFSFYPVWGSSVAIQQDGKIVEAGYSSYDFVLTRFNTDGSQDNSFGINGTTTTEIGYGTSACIQPDGRIVMVGGGGDFTLAMYTANGILDNTFDSDGIVITDIDTSIDYASSVFTQPDEKIVVAGFSYKGTHKFFTLVRYNIDGSLDDNFGIDGKVMTNMGTNEVRVSSATLQSDGKIIMAGSANNGIDDDFALIRYNTDGTLDSSFNLNGIVITDINMRENEAYSVLIQPDGKIVSAGYVYNGVSTDFALVRYNADGILDSVFGTYGILTTDFNTADDKVQSVAMQPDGKIVVVGESNGRFALARYLSGVDVGMLILAFNDLPTLIYPNPIQSEALLEYTLPNEECITISLFNVNGDQVQSFITNETKNSGEHEEVLHLDQSLSAGNYILSISTGLHSQSIKIVKQ